jgi:hypothetical protein
MLVTVVYLDHCPNVCARPAEIRDGGLADASSHLTVPGLRPTRVRRLSSVLLLASGT